MNIVLASQKGGVGKSTFTINLAVYLKNKGKKVNIIDADYKQPSSAKWTKYRLSNNLIPIPSILQYGKLQEVIKEQSKNYDDTIIDVPGRDSIEMRSALSICDIAIVPFLASQFDLDTLPELNEIIEGAKALNTRLKVYAVFNRIATNPKIKEKEEALEFFQEYHNIYNVLKHGLYERKIYRDSVAEGKSVLETKNLNAINEINTIFNSIFNSNKE